MSKVKVLTVQFDVTDMTQEAIDDVIEVVSAAAENYQADFLRANVAKVDVDDV